MLVHVKRLRHRGARIHDREREATAPLEGNLTVYGMGTTIQLSLHAHDVQTGPPLLPNLYDARLVTMHGNGMLFFGLERTENPDAAQYAQEWSVRIIRL